MLLVHQAAHSNVNIFWSSFFFSFLFLPVLFFLPVFTSVCVSVLNVVCMYLCADEGAITIGVTAEPQAHHCSASALINKALKEPSRDRKKVKNIKHTGRVSFDEIGGTARPQPCRATSQAGRVCGTKWTNSCPSLPSICPISHRSKCEMTSVTHTMTAAATQPRAPPVIAAPGRGEAEGGGTVPVQNPGTKGQSSGPRS